MSDVPSRLEPVEGRKVIAHRDALSELPELPAIELLAQLGLADEDDLQKFALVGLQIRKQPHLLEELGVEILRLVDQEDDVVAGPGLLQQKPIENLEVRRLVELLRLEAQLGEDRAHQLGRRDHGIENQGRAVARPQLREDRAADRRLAGSDLPVIWMNPLRSRIPKRTWLNASRCLSEKKRNRGSGVMLNGASRKP